MAFSTLNTSSTANFTLPGTPTKPFTNDGSAAQETAKIALFLTTFSGEVQVAFRKNRAMYRADGAPRYMRKVVPDGFESSTFRQVGKGTVRRHMSGQNILQDTDVGGTNRLISQVDMGEFKIYLDRPNIAATVVDSWENRRNSFDVRREISNQFGMDLADQYDTEMLQLVIKAAQGGLTQTSNYISEIPTSGVLIEDANAATQGSALLDSIRQVTEAWDTANMIRGRRYIALPPAQYNLLVQNQDLLNRDFGGANGIYSDGTVYRAWGAELVKTTGLPTGDTSTDTLYINGVHGETYNVDATNTVAVGWIDMAVASAEAESISVRMDDRVEYGGDLIVARASMGHGILYPKGCAQIRTATP